MMKYFITGIGVLSLLIAVVVGADTLMNSRMAGLILWSNSLLSFYQMQV